MESAGPTLAPHHRRLEPRHVLSLIAAAGIGLAAVSGFTSLPLPPCPFRTMAHLPCPGCGMTRSVAALLHGNLTLSFRYHPLGIVLLLGAICCLPLPWIPANTFRKVERAMPSQQVIAFTALGLLLSVWTLRLAFIFSGSEFFLW